MEESQHGLGGAAARRTRSGRAPTGANVSSRRAARGQERRGTDCAAPHRLLLAACGASALPPRPNSQFAAAAAAAHGMGRVSLSLLRLRLIALETDSHAGLQRRQRAELHE